MVKLDSILYFYVAFWHKKLSFFFGSACHRWFSWHILVHTSPSDQFLRLLILTTAIQLVQKWGGGERKIGSLLKPKRGGVLSLSMCIEQPFSSFSTVVRTFYPPLVLLVLRPSRFLQKHLARWTLAQFPCTPHPTPPPRCTQRPLPLQLVATPANFAARRPQNKVSRALQCSRYMWVLHSSGRTCWSIGDKISAPGTSKLWGLAAHIYIQ